MRRSIGFLGLALVLALGMISFKRSANSLEVVKTDAGRISGVINAAGDVHAFKDIPFVASPVGDRRWKEPQAVKPWDTSGRRLCNSRIVRLHPMGRRVAAGLCFRNAL